jgi:hypothetical protein
MKLSLKAGAAIAAFVFAASPALAASGADALKALNKDNDDTLEIAEVIHAGVATFQAINPDGDTTLESGETKGRLTEKDWKRANTDGDETLEVDEYLKILRTRFKRADANKDGKLTAAELDSKAGQGVLVLILK